MNSLLTGTEGTLGFATKATLKLAHIPEEYGVAGTTFASRKAAQADTEVMRQGIPVAEMELLDDVQIAFINRLHWSGVESPASSVFLHLAGREPASRTTSTADCNGEAGRWQRL